MRKDFFSVPLVLTFLLAAPVLAQEGLPKAEKRENVQYYEALFVKFKPGMQDQAWEAIYEHFINVDKKIGRKVRAYDLQTGDWDMVVFFPIEGPEYFSWSTSPQNEKWWAAFVELEGGMEAANKIWKSYESAVAHSSTQLAHRHLEIDR